MRLTTRSDIVRLKAVATLFIVLGAIVISTKAIGPLALEGVRSAFTEVNALITGPAPTKPELAGKSRHYLLVDGPDGATLVPK
jgi:hypothetical protein